jgi:hypothetical protein
VDDELTPEQKFAAEDPETMVPEDIVRELLRLDWSPAAARALVARVADDLERFHQSPESREHLVREARVQWAAGVLIALLGASMTAFTLLAALGGAMPFFVIAFGIIFTGLVVAGRGWARWRLYRGQGLPFDPDPPR